MSQEEMNAERAYKILENIQGGVILCNYDMTAKDAEIIYINRGWTDITGYTLEQLNAEKKGNPQALLLTEDKAETDADYAQQLTVGNTYELLYRICHRGGEIRWVIDKGIIRPLPDGRIQNQSILTEVTAIKKREERMTLLAQTDQLTGLNNKVTFTLLAQTTLNRRGDCKYALLILDIDGFKGINDSYGHGFGDKVLVEVSQRLKETFRSSDIVGRIGGDEFMVLMTDVSLEEVALRKTRELCAAVHAIRFKEHDDAVINVSVGISVFQGSRPFESIFAEADNALYRAKGNGKNQYMLFSAP